MCKELKAFKVIKAEIIALNGEDYDIEDDEELNESLDIVEAALIDKEKKDKVLEIIRNKHIPKYTIDTLEQDWNLIEVKGKDITKEEYDLLKEVLL